MANFPFNIEFGRPRSPRRSNFEIAPLMPRDHFAYAMQALNDNNRPEGNLNAANQNVGRTIKKDKDKFKIFIEVDNFWVEEISVKTKGGFIIVEANHCERADELGFVSRYMTKRYPVPEGINPDMVVAKLHSDGVLSITAPLDVVPTNSDERVVPIVKVAKYARKIYTEKL